MNDRLYSQDQDSYKENRKKKSSSHTSTRSYLDLSVFPTEGLKKEIYDYFCYLGNEKNLSCKTLQTYADNARELGLFFSTCHPKLESARAVPEEGLLRNLKHWMIQNQLPLYKMQHNTGNKTVYRNSPVILFLKSLIVFLIKNEDIPETEKDIWTLEKIPGPIRQNPVAVQKYLNFRSIPQHHMRNEVKRACQLFLFRDAVRTLQERIMAAGKLAKYLQKHHPEISSFTQLDRLLIEEYLICLRTEGGRKACCAAQIGLLKTLVEEIGRITNINRLEHLFLSSDKPTHPCSLYRPYSETELERIHDCIMQLPPQYARVMLIHELLGTRISDTLTLKQNALEERDGRWLLRIDQVKSRHSFEKPINQLLVDLLHASIRYTQAQFPDSPYIFADETDPMRPVPYSFLMKMLKSVYKYNDLRNDNGEPMRAETHIFRKMYGQRLTDMDIDDEVIAKLLGHRSTASVKFYRKTSYKKLAEDSKKLREHMDAILSEIIKDW